MHKSEALECPWWIMDGLQHFCRQNNSSSMSKWGIQLLLLKTQHRCSAYKIEGVAWCASVPQDTVIVLYIAQEKIKPIVKEISSKHMCTRGCPQLHAGPLFPHFSIPFNICTDSSANTGWGLVFDHTDQLTENMCHTFILKFDYSCVRSSHLDGTLKEQFWSCFQQQFGCSCEARVTLQIKLFH